MYIDWEFLFGFNSTMSTDIDQVGSLLKNLYLSSNIKDDSWKDLSIFLKNNSQGYFVFLNKSTFFINKNLISRSKQLVVYQIHFK